MAFFRFLDRKLNLFVGIQFEAGISIGYNDII